MNEIPNMQADKHGPSAYNVYLEKYKVSFSFSNFY